MIRMIAAVSQNGVIGQDNKLPFDYPEDLLHFRKSTLHSTIIMGRKTFEGIGRALPKRTNIVVTKQKIDNIDTQKSLSSAINAALDLGQDVWLIGGASIYREGMQYAEEIWLTLTPDIIEGDGLVYFPWIDPSVFEVADIAPLGHSDVLKFVRYSRVKS